MRITREGQPHPPFVCLFARAPRENLLFGNGKSCSLTENIMTDQAHHHRMMGQAAQVTVPANQDQLFPPGALRYVPAEDQHIARNEGHQRLNQFSGRFAARSKTRRRERGIQSPDITHNKCDTTISYIQTLTNEACFESDTHGRYSVDKID